MKHAVKVRCDVISGSGPLAELVKNYSGHPLPPDPGPGRAEQSYWLDVEQLRTKAALAGESRPAVFLRRLILWNYERRRVAPIAPDWPNRAIPAPSPSAPASNSIPPAPKDVRRLALTVEQAHGLLRAAGYPPNLLQPNQACFLQGNEIFAEESGREAWRKELPA